MLFWELSTWGNVIWEIIRSNLRGLIIQFGATRDQNSISKFLFRLQWKTDFSRKETNFRSIFSFLRALGINFYPFAVCLDQVWKT